MRDRSAGGNSDGDRGVDVSDAGGECWRLWQWLVCGGGNGTVGKVAEALEVAVVWGNGVGDIGTKGGTGDGDGGRDAIGGNGRNNAGGVTLAMQVVAMVAVMMVVMLVMELRMCQWEVAVLVVGHRGSGGGCKRWWWWCWQW